MKVYRTRNGVIVEKDDGYRRVEGISWDDLLNHDDPVAMLEGALQDSGAPMQALSEDEILAPVESQEVWAAGVTYFRSRTARMEESQAAGGGSFYDRVYDAERPEIFFKSAPWRVIGTGGDVRIRRDSKWNVPEPELALVINSRGEIIGYTIGNDVSSRDIEGENPLYLPQAKCYDGACGLGPCVLLTKESLPPETSIELEIVRAGETVFQGSTSLSQMKRNPQELVDYLYLETTFPQGAVLLTGTGIVPDEPFTLQAEDEVRITIPPIGTLVNNVGE
jgi:2-dehydro-3-deoxy-D-arabinonate dehydratase